ncbi:hypothetical protein LAZ67_19002272 [Cordylochernes scorpioides]|uniref:Reverse transcriptase/retrotransposon-derived protein RNase H-like domain-containing protein n=1 Tax=Cordylochernes scorpioides TaxID=51811 RepID=A0ABY6LIE4_9ARAC|nr:hypothetical protein LAZ67_19002272 [Cordylochernes scorpioides]
MRFLREAVRLKRPERWQNNDWILHVGNARPHTAHVVLQFLAKHSTIQIPHPPYSPDLTPNDFFLYPKLKMNLKGRKFNNVDMIQAESKATLRNLSKSVLKQVYPDGKTYTVQNFSRSLRAHERDYSNSELQCLAIVESLDNFRNFLMGRKFTIRGILRLCLPHPRLFETESIASADQFLAGPGPLARPSHFERVGCSGCARKVE